MKYISKLRNNISESFWTDPNINRVKSWADPIRRRLPSATAEYLAEKLPAAQWLPNYNFKWILNDIIGGITIGVMLIPQGLAYAKIANIPVEHGLYSSWLPSALYFFLGTSKGKSNPNKNGFGWRESPNSHSNKITEVSSGPTSILGLFTAEAVADLSKQGYDPANIASAMAFLVGVYALAIGLLKLGFLLDFVSGPVLTGWISAVAFVIGLGQVGSLIGITTGSGTVTILRDVLGHLDKIKPLTLCVGLTGIAMLYALQWVGRAWSGKNRWLKFLSTSRAVVVLVVYTIISFLVNKDRKVKEYAWSVTQVNTKGLLPPQAHDGSLVQKMASRSIAPLIAMAVEHLGVAKAFGLRNNYSIDKSQELVFLGTSNIANSFFGAQTCGGAMSRTAVNSECGVKSPVNFLFTAGFIILTLYELAPALYWIPKATLSAIIIMAVAHLVSSPRLFYRYWRMSSMDFIASMLGFWVTLFTTTEIGLAVAVAFSIVYTLIRLAFPKWVGLSHRDTETVHWSPPKHHRLVDGIDVPAEAYLVRFTEDLLFPNAERVKNAIVEAVKVQFEPASSAARDILSAEGSWNVASAKRIDKIRRRTNVVPLKCDLVPLRHVVLDFTMVGFLDVTGLLSLIELKMELRRYIGADLQFRFVNMVDEVYERFRRSEWEFSRQGEQRTGEADTIYNSLEAALFHHDGDEKSDNVSEKALDV
ncbi:sulfate permease [Cordyceps fumosorosea ARSEF 2679]|uniref:Sulfate permease n=1 Tax=Cordyceps fumosorosea (strain ARSEF 2679) TaxID=1081104 RepID=A0A167V297_CORFA|nr:sulfate permease [Cordyceps fumosorosea ARSEF 2679]OAA62150.1 sulfate permease [Cordyceps fumosorosea ARSEF 2679]